MKKIIVFNWKMNLADFIQTDKNIFSFVQREWKNDVEIVVCPPFTHLEKAKNLLPSYAKLGAQNCFWEFKGAYTGEISPKMLKNLGAEYVIIGHSERRKYLNETDVMINKKVLAGLKAGLKVVLCVGESKRELGSKNYELGKVKNFIKKQLKQDLEEISSLVIGRKSLVNNLVIAYEPIWAIGTGYSDTPEDAVEIIKFIKSFVVSHLSLAVPVLYGGSVDSKNIADFLKCPEIDGVLVGGASLRLQEIRKIIKITAKIV